MIDNLTIRTICTNQDFERLTARLGLSIPITSNKIKFDWSNLRFTYYPDNNSLTLSNSLHKFYNLEFNELIKQPVNHTDFSLTNFTTVAYYLSEAVFDKPLDELHISSRFEFGLNINTGIYKPFYLLNKYQSCVTTHANEFYTVDPYKGKPIQRNCRFSDWYIKGYDKGKQADLANVNLLRYEIVISEMRKLRQILDSSSTTIADVCSVYAWNALFNFLTKTYINIRKVPEIGGQVLTVEEVNAIYSYCNKMKRSDLKNHLSSYYFEQLNKQNKSVYNKFNLVEGNYHNTVLQKMLNKYTSLVPESSGELQHV